ncbi:MAG: sigma-54 dependent transcriptional regulator [Planctomycetia bacterium]|nr:sigma-54 dependent transcriptional regulator [Planctomycetia bacterium]
MSRILILDDEAAIGWSLRELLSDDGHAVMVAASVEEALEICAHFTPDVILLDVRLPGRDGLSALPEFRTLAPAAAVIVMTAFGDLDTAVRTVKAGAFDYLVKPFDLERVAAVVARALSDRAQSAPAALVSGLSSDSQLVGQTLPMQTVFKQIALVAPSDLPVLITGETGTGKELAARAIHANSPRRDRPLITTSVASLAASVIESELFGHVRGAFTGAVTDRKGLLELADGGTIFLDEVGEIPAQVQVKLLRAIEHREITPVGTAVSRSVDVRVIAATNRDLGDAIARGLFREDLYHRLCVFPIEMPRLATRLEDLPVLVAHFLQPAKDAEASVLSAEFLECLRDRHWPGNVRELKHAVEYARLLARGGTLRPEHLPPVSRHLLSTPLSTPRSTPLSTPVDPINSMAVPASVPQTTADEQVAAAIGAWVASLWKAGDGAPGTLHEQLMDLVERTLAEEVIQRTAGNRTAAAKVLGLDRATLRGKLKR